MIYLLEFDVYDLAQNKVVTQRFSTHGYATKPTDTPSNTFYSERIQQAGNYERSVFANGTTSGEPDATFGFIELANADGGLDYLTNVAVDGRQLRIIALSDRMASWSSRMTLFVGTMEQIEHSWTTVTIRLRDRLFELKKNIQTNLYLGTTTAGGQNTAEGTPDDLKDKPKPILFGAAFNFLPVLANRFDRIYQVSDGAFNSGIVVRDAGVPLTFAADYATITALRTATIPSGGFATARALGLFRIQSNPLGDITVDASEGADGSRSAARTVARILQRFGFTSAQYSQTDIEALHALNPAEVGIWTGAETQETFSIIARLLDSIGATVVPDRLGVLRFFRIDAPSGTPVAVFDRTRILDNGQGLERISTNDEGRGVPAKKVSVTYAFNYTLQSGTALAGAATEAFKAFAKESVRTSKAEDTSVAAIFLVATELEFDTLLTQTADAQNEANRRLGIFKIKRDRYRVKLKTDYTTNIDLGKVISLQVPRFGLDAGKPFLVIGMNENYRDNTTTLDLFG
jgi:hypothetical protein